MLNQRKQTGVASELQMALCQDADASFSFPSHPASTLSNANLLLLYISPTAVDLK